MDNDDDVVAEKYRRLNEKKVSIRITSNDYQKFIEYLDLKYDSDIHGIEQKELEIVSVFKVRFGKL
jgi:hypothetical protein